MKQLFAVAILAISIPITSNVYGARIIITPSEMQPYALSAVCEDINCVDSLPWFAKIKEIKPSEAPIVLKEKTELGFFERALIRKANSIFENNPAVAMILIDKGEIIFERYHPAVTESVPLLGYSMSKSLTSMVIGKALCSGYLPSLDKKMQEVNSSLDGTSYGDATIRQVLMMSSGGIRGSAPSGGNPHKSGLGNVSDRQTYWHTLNHLKKFALNQRKQDGTAVKAGDEFSYKNLDTQSLAFLFPTTGENSFQSIFEREIWQASGTESEGYWVHDLDGVIHTPASFHARPRDWARIAMKILETVSSDSADCFTTYMKSATSTQIKNSGSSMPPDNWIGRAFGGYGYHFWTENENDSEAIYINGYLGQRIAIHPTKQRIMVVFSYKENYMHELYKLFSSW